MKKTIIGSILLFVMLATLNISAFAKNMILEYDGKTVEYTGSIYKLMVNGKVVKTPLEPIIFNDRALVPVREVFEAAGAEVNYNHNNRKITIMGEEVWIVMQIGNPNVETTDFEGVFPDGLTPKLIAKKGEDAKTMVPVRFISETLGYTVDFTGEAINIITNEKTGSILETSYPMRPTANPSARPTVQPTPSQSAKPSQSASPSPSASPSLAPDVTETPKPTPVLKNVYCKTAGDVVFISIKADQEIEEISNPILTSAGVLYFDISGVKSSLPNEMKVNRGAVKKIRTGIHDEHIRIAIDTNELQKHKTEISKDKKTIIVTLTKIPKDADEVEKIVVIDAGHGGKDGGAVRDLPIWEEIPLESPSPTESASPTEPAESPEPTPTRTPTEIIKILEKDINLAVSKKVVEILEQNGITVYMTRTGDTYPELTERAEFANALGAAMFVSIHSNSATTAVPNGIEVYYSKQNNDTDYVLTSKKLAEEILKDMIKYTEANNRKVKTEDHVVTRKSLMPAVLIELGFITNDEEAKKLIDEEYQEKLAKGIAEGIMNCIDEVVIPSGEDFEFDENDPGEKIA